MVARTTAALLGLFSGANAQVFHLDGMKVPTPYTLSTHYLFHVYSETDTPSKDATPTVEFRQVSSQVAGANGPKTSPYNSLEISLLPWDHFWSIVDKEHFCSGPEGEFKLQKPKKGELADLGARVQKMPLMTSDAGAEKKTQSFPITQTGRYILTLSNCGNFSDATVHGSVAVKNSYGFLPGYEYFSMRFYGWMAIIYVITFAVWTGVAVRYWSDLLYLQKGMIAVVGMCFLEAFFTWASHNDWNSNGVRRDWIFITAVMCYTLKYVSAWRLIMALSLGEGIHAQDMSMKNGIIFFLISTLFLIQACVWKHAMAYRFSHALTINFLLMVTIPGVLVWMVFFIWALFLLSSSIEQTVEQKLDDLISLFSTSRFVLCGGAMLAFCVMLVQVVDVAMGGMESWEYRWVTVDGAPHLAFFTVLLFFMAVWWPKAGKNYGYGTVASPDEEREGLQNGVGNKVAPDAIGIGEDNDDP